MMRRRDLLARLSLLSAFGEGDPAWAIRGSNRGPSPAAPEPSPLPIPVIQSVDGPLVVTANLARQREMFEGALGMTLAADQDLGVPAVRALFGVPDRAARTVLLQTKGTEVGVRLIEFRPSSTISVREGARPLDADALKVIDFMVPDFEKAVSALSTRGFPLAAPAAEYTTPEDGRFTEGHVEGPDGVVCALLKMHDTPLSKYVSVADRTFSEILGVSSPVSDREGAVAFYRNTLRLDALLTYEIANESFQKLLGSREKTLLRGANFGVGHKAPMIGVIHYGLPSSAFRSLRDRSVLPNRGLLAIRLSVPSVDEVVRAAATANLEITAPVAEALLFPQGWVKSVLIRAPHGVLHHFTETLKA